MDPQQIFGRLKTLFASFTPGQLVSLGVAFVLVVGIFAGSAWWMNQTTYALLFADMDPQTAGDIVTRLKNANVPYQLDPGGRAVRVPADRVDELRLEMTAEGMPDSGRVGFEIFDRTAFGATEFLEQVNYRRALEGEIARTVGTISEVASARVHIAMAKDTLFGDPRPAKASVILKLRGSRALSASTVNGISNLVAASVEGLRPEAVVILDSFGRPLARPEMDPNDPLGAAQAERQQRLEREMAARVVALLEPVVGPERVRVNVAMKLNPQTREETEERWDPNAVVRSRQMTADVANGNLGMGVAGARSNTPPPTPPAAGQQAANGTQPPAPGAPGGPASSRSAETTNYEISRTTRHVIEPPGDVARLSVAVILDDDQVFAKNEDGTTKITRTARKPEDLQKIQGLVAAAVGLEPDRGDQLTVQNISFDEPEVEEATPPTIFEKIAPKMWEGGRLLAIAAIGFFALVFFVRPLMRRAGVEVVQREEMALAAATAMPVGGGGPIRTVADLESEIEAQIDAAAAQRLEGRRLPVLTKKVSNLSQKEPENVAKLLRSWISEPER